MQGGRPSGTVTFLFTDIEGSTRLWEEQPRAMEQALARHDEIMRGAIAAHGGYVFATGGDGFAAAFNTPSDAVMASIGAQRGLAEGSLNGGLGLKVRMGIHTGVAHERDGDYFGEAPTRTARIMDAAWGGQILCSGVAGRMLGGQFELDGLGEHRLKDLAEPIQLFQVPSQGGEEFPRPRSLNHVAGNLPLLLTNLVGRDELVADLVEKVRGHRLLTLSGVGGVGKTRLALQLGAETALDFEDGCWLVELAPVRQSGEVAEAIVAALRIAVRSGMDALQSAVDYLMSQHLVLLLDNCEHVVGAVRSVASEILQACPHVHILATSREGLGLSGEQMVAVPSLAHTSDGGAASSPAVRLFLDRAGELCSWQPLDSDLPWIAELCRHLDGIPLAIELAAGRASVLSPEDMVGLLDDRFRLLTGQRDGQLERHQTLRAAVEWSYDLLEGSERQVFDGLGVFVGSFDLQAAAAVAGDGADPIGMIDTLSLLIGRSLVQLDRRSSKQRYRLLETLRQYAVERLAVGGRVDEMRRAHAEHHAAAVAVLAGELKGPGQPAAFEAVMDMASDLRAAVAFATDVGDGALAASLVGPFHNGPCTTVHGISSLASDALIAVGRSDPTWGCALLNLAAWAAYTSADLERVTQARDAVIAATEATDPVVASEAWRVRSCLTALTGDGDAAVVEARRAFEVASQADLQFEQASTLMTAAAWSGGFGEPDLELAEQSLALARTLGNPWLLGYASFALAFAIELSDPGRSLAMANGARVDPQEAIDSSSVVSESVAGRILLRQGNYEAALERFHPHMAMNYRDGLQPEFSYSAAAAAGALAALGHPKDAAVIHAALRGKSPWVNQLNAEQVADEIIADALDPLTRAQLKSQGEAMSFREAAQFALDTVEFALAD